MKSRKILVVNKIFFIQDIVEVNVFQYSKKIRLKKKLKIPEILCILSSLNSGSKNDSLFNMKNSSSVGF